jgi:hypothetical protein
VHVAEHAITVESGGDDIRTALRTTTQAVRSIKAHRSPKPRTTHVSQGIGSRAKTDAMPEGRPARRLNKNGRA